MCLRDMFKLFWVLFAPSSQSSPLICFLDEHMLRFLKHSDNFLWPAESVIIYYTLFSLLLTLLVGILQWLLARKLAQGAPSADFFSRYNSKKFNCNILYPCIGVCIHVCV